MTKPAFWGALTGSAAHGLGEDPMRPFGVADAGVGFVLHQISNTMLGRRLMFFVDGVLRLQCDAEMRRLLAFSVFDASGVKSYGHSLGDEDDVAAAERVVAVLEEALVGLCDKAEEISLKCDPLGAVDEVGRAGLPVEQLILRLGLAEGQVDAETRLRSFYERARHILPVAAISRNDMIHELRGSDAELKVLLTVCGDLSRNVAVAEGASRSSSKWRLLIVAGADHGNDEYLIAEQGAHTLMAQTIRDDMPTLLTLWFSGFGR